MQKDCPISLLCAEDDSDARTMIEKLIRHKFPEVSVYGAASGEEGLALYMEHRPDIIITDIAMPGIDGIEMTKKIRDINPGVYVMALTAFSDTDWESRCKGVKFNHCITKPVQFAPLLAAIAKAVEDIAAKCAMA